MKGKIIWIAAGLVFLVALLLVVKIGSNTVPTTDGFITEPVLTISLEDEHNLLVFGIAERDWVEGSARPPAAFGFGGRRSGSKGGSFEKAPLSFRSSTRNDDLVMISLSRNFGDLLMSVALEDAFGKNLSSDDTNEKILIEIADGEGGWNQGSGPHHLEIENLTRNIVVFPGWTRSPSELHFRVSLAGQAAKEFKLPNPNQSTKPESWTPVTLPHQVKHADWEFELTEVTETIVPGAGRLIVPKDKFKSLIGKADELSPMRFGLQYPQGSLGTHSDQISLQRFFTPKPDPHHDLSIHRIFGYPFPAEEKLIKFHYRVSYQPNYPYPRTAATILAEGTVSMDGQSILLTAPYKKLGMTNLSLGPITPSTRSMYPGSQSIRVEINGHFDNKAHRTAVMKGHNDWDKLTGLVFIDKSATSIGAVHFSGSGSSRMGGREEFNISGTWYGELKPGSSFEFGVMNTKPDELFEIVVDRSKLLSN